MKQIIIFFTALMISFISPAQRKSSSDVQVKGYYRNNGTYVNPHYRTSPNATNVDNFSTIGNTNPYTGKNGTIQPDQNFKIILLPMINLILTITQTKTNLYRNNIIIL